MCKYHPIIPKPSAYTSYIAINKHQYLCIYVYADRETTDRRKMWRHIVCWASASELATNVQLISQWRNSTFYSNILKVTMYMKTEPYVVYVKSAWIVKCGSLSVISNPDAQIQTMTFSNDKENTARTTLVKEVYTCTQRGLCNNKQEPFTWVFSYKTKHSQQRHFKTELESLLVSSESNYWPFGFMTKQNWQY